MFIDYNKCTTVVRDIGSVRVYGYVGTGDIWELYVLLAQFCCKPKIFLKTQVYQLKKEMAWEMCGFLSGCAALQFQFFFFSISK